MRMIMDIFAQVLRTLWAHKLRSFLTMFGVAWGVGSLLLLVGLGEGFRSGNRRNLAEFGENIMFIFPGRAPVIASSMNSARNYLLTYQDYADIRAEAPHVRKASPVLYRDDVRGGEFAGGADIIAGKDRRSLADMRSFHADVRIVLVSEQIVAGGVHAGCDHRSASRKDKHDVFAKFGQVALVSRAEALAQTH